MRSAFYFGRNANLAEMCDESFDTKLTKEKYQDIAAYFGELGKRLGE